LAGRFSPWQQAPGLHSRDAGMGISLYSLLAIVSVAADFGTGR